MNPSTDFRVVRCLGGGEWTQSFLIEYPGGLQAVARRLRPGAPAQAGRQLAASTLAGYQLRVRGIRMAMDLPGEGAETTAVYEYLAGQSLADRLASGPLNNAETVAILREVAGIVQAVQEKGLIQRDLRPENIWLGPEGQVRMLDADAARPHLAFALAAPEQLSPRSEAGPATDVYALGMLAYVMLTGDHPFSEDFPDQREIRWRVLNQPLPSLRHVPAWLNEVICQATCKEPSRRFSNAASLAAALDAHMPAPGKAGSLRWQSVVAPMATSLLPGWLAQWFV